MATKEKDLKELFLDTLKDIYYAEKQIYKALPKMAKAAASEAGLLAARVALQTHGAIGFTQEHDLSLWLLRVQALRSAWGDPEAHRHRVLEAL